MNTDVYEEQVVEKSLDIIQWKPWICCWSAMYFTLKEKKLDMCVPDLVTFRQLLLPFLFYQQRIHLYMRFESSCCGYHEDLCLLDYDTLYCSQNLLGFGGTFCFHPQSRTVVLLRKWKNQLLPKHQDISTRMHGVTWRNAVIFIIYSVFTLHLIIFCEWYLCMQGQY
jgi:hypothetical protein